MIKNIIERNFHILQLDDEVGYLFQEKPLVSYRRDRNVKDMLVHANIGVNSKVGKTRKCVRTRCFTCPHVFDDVHQVRGPKGVYSPKDNISCISKDIIYCIECLKCGSLYIGETERRLGDRIREHLRDIKTKQPQKQVSVHFNSQGHSLNDLKVQVLYQNFRDKFSRKAKESFLIQKLGTVFPDGMNIDGGIET